MSTEDLLGAKDGGAKVEGDRASRRAGQRRTGPTASRGLQRQVDAGAPGGVGGLLRLDGLRPVPLTAGSETARSPPSPLTGRASGRQPRGSTGGRRLPSAGIAPTVRAATERRLAGGPNIAASMPPARYTVEGTVEPDDWPNFQIDGYGTWLWALSEHVATGAPSRWSTSWARASSCLSSYLEAVGLDPCYDCWEENGQAVHTSTLACVYGGLSAAAELLGRPAAARKAEEVAEHIHSRMRSGSRFAKSSVEQRGRRQPPVVGRTLRRGQPGRPGHGRHRGRRSRTSLVLDGGIRRYAADTLLRRGGLAAAYGLARLVPGQRRRPGYARNGAPSWVEQLLRRRRPPPRAGRRRTPRPRLRTARGWAVGAHRRPT